MFKFFFQNQLVHFYKRFVFSKIICLFVFREKCLSKFCGCAIETIENAAHFSRTHNMENFFEAAVFSGT